MNMLLIVDRSNQELHRANASSVMSQDGLLENVARESYSYGSGRKRTIMSS